MCSQLPVKELYQKPFLKLVQKTDKEMEFCGRHICKADLEIELLEHQVAMGELSQYEFC